ncbi:hypothetical protein [Tsuneonella sp. HG222]
MTDVARHAASLRKLADMIERDGDKGEALAFLLLLAKALVREERQRK